MVLLTKYCLNSKYINNFKSYEQCFNPLSFMGRPFDIVENLMLG